MIAVVGAGCWGKNLVRNFAELDVLHTVCDINPQALTSFPIETDFQRVLGNSEIKGIAIACPNIYHYPIAKESLLAGKDVFVEKPMTLDVGHAEELVELAQDRILMVGHILEYHPAIIRLKELVDNGELGEIKYVYSHRVNQSNRNEKIIWDLAPHDVSAMSLLLGTPEVVSCQVNSDVALVSLRFKDVMGHIFLSRIHPYRERRLTVVGDKKTAVFDDVNENHLVLYGQQQEIIETSRDEPLRLECQDFIDCIKTRKHPKADGRKGLEVVRILLLCDG